MGRPRNLTDSEVFDLVAAFEEYVDGTDIPIVAEFAYQHKVNRQTLYDYDEFSTLTKRAIEKKEAQLERMALDGKIDRTMAIFSLKQLGWSDKQQVEHSGDGVNFNVTIMDP